MCQSRGVTLLQNRSSDAPLTSRDSLVERNALRGGGCDGNGLGGRLPVKILRGRRIRAYRALPGGQTVPASSTTLVPSCSYISVRSGLICTFTLSGYLARIDFLPGLGHL